jgi:hypothetical protein
METYIDATQSVATLTGIAAQGRPWPVSGDNLQVSKHLATLGVAGSVLRDIDLVELAERAW